MVESHKNKKILVLTTQGKINEKSLLLMPDRLPSPARFLECIADFHLVADARMLVIPKILGGFPLGLGNPTFSFALGFLKHLEELRGNDSKFTASLARRLGGSTYRELAGPPDACSVSEGRAHFLLDCQEVIPIKMYLKYLL